MKEKIINIDGFIAKDKSDQYKKKSYALKIFN